MTASTSIPPSSCSPARRPGELGDSDSLGEPSSPGEQRVATAGAGVGLLMVGGCGGRWTVSARAAVGALPGVFPDPPHPSFPLSPLPRALFLLPPHPPPFKLSRRGRFQSRPASILVKAMPQPELAMGRARAHPGPGMQLETSRRIGHQHCRRPKPTSELRLRCTAPHAGTGALWFTAPHAGPGARPAPCRQVSVELVYHF